MLKFWVKRSNGKPLEQVFSSDVSVYYQWSSGLGTRKGSWKGNKQTGSTEEFILKFLKKFSVWRTNDYNMQCVPLPPMCLSFSLGLKQVFWVFFKKFFLLCFLSAKANKGNRTPVASPSTASMYI